MRPRRMMRGLLVATILVISVGVATVAVAAGGCVVCDEGPTTAVAPQGGRSFIGTQVVPGSGGRAQTIGAAAGGSSCPGCSYRVVPLCDDGVGCREQGGQSCPDPGDVRYAVYVTVPGRDEATADSICLGAGEQPVAIDDITTAVRTLLDELVPTDGQVRIQPPNGRTLVQLPTIFPAGGGREPVSKQFFAAGFAVQVTARPVLWTWNFEPGASRTVSMPGEAYEQGADLEDNSRHVTYTYRRTGSHQVGLTVTWEAQYDLPGIGTVPVGRVQGVSPSQPLQVVAARSELVSG